MDQQERIEVRAQARREAFEEAAQVLRQEAREQWERDAGRAPGAQLIAQRMDVVEKVLLSFAGAEPGERKRATDAAALDRIAEVIALDEDGTWCDHDGILESVGNAVRATGRTIENWE
ncbi:hypothetical protein [Prescottella equi]|uniref:hypothetical protein n=1 Tax=Rhodococcus hoagii TaxID=43767 RepID=UPI000D110FCF|nr:hypothetical protein [Prescottella equi]AVP71280.1 hypothetical protein C7H75_24675 [Prescottella equi]